MSPTPFSETAIQFCYDAQQSPRRQDHTRARTGRRRVLVSARFAKRAEIVVEEDWRQIGVSQRDLVAGMMPAAIRNTFWQTSEARNV
jgi:hypothetical protein